MSTPHKPLVILQADPHPKERIFTPDALARLHDRFTVVEPDSRGSLRQGAARRLRRSSASPICRPNASPGQAS